VKAQYKQWLQSQGYGAGTIAAQLHRSGRVEDHYGDIDQHYSHDRLSTVIRALTYTSDDERRGRPNPSKIPFDGDPRKNLSSYKNAIALYVRFRDAASADFDGEPTQTISPTEVVENEPAERIGLERDLQRTLRKQIEQLEAGLTIADGGGERAVSSGFIDITATDSNGRTVVIELKAGVAGQRAVAQILSYMGDVADEEDEKMPRGILVASDFDAKARSAARMVPTLQLKAYSVRFAFSD
jgi:hypothetical protein